VKGLSLAKPRLSTEITDAARRRLVIAMK
jgi:hypothetical protein